MRAYTQTSLLKEREMVCIKDSGIKNTNFHKLYLEGKKQNDNIRHRQTGIFMLSPAFLQCYFG